MAKMQASLSTGDAYADGIVARTLREVATVVHEASLQAERPDVTPLGPLADLLMQYADKVEGSPNARPQAAHPSPVHERMTDREAAVIGAARSLLRTMDGLGLADIRTMFPQLDRSLWALLDSARNLVR